MWYTSVSGSGTTTVQGQIQFSRRIDNVTFLNITTFKDPLKTNPICLLFDDPIYISLMAYYINWKKTYYLTSQHLQ